MLRARMMRCLQLNFSHYDPDTHSCPSSAVMAIAYMLRCHSSDHCPEPCSRQHKHVTCRTSGTQCGVQSFAEQGSFLLAMLFNASSPIVLETMLLLHCQRQTRCIRCQGDYPLQFALHTHLNVPGISPEVPRRIALPGIN